MPTPRDLGGARSSRKQRMRSAAYSVREHRKTEVDAEIRRSSQVEGSADDSWGHPPVRVERRFALRTTEKSVVFLYSKSPQLPSTEGAFDAMICVFTFEFITISFNAHPLRLGRSKEFMESRREERSVLST